MTHKTRTGHPPRREDIENDRALLAKLVGALPSRSVARRLSESDIQDNLACYIAEIEAAIQKARTCLVLEVGGQAVAVLRDAAVAGDMKLSLNDVVGLLNDAASELRRLPRP